MKRVVILFVFLLSSSFLFGQTKCGVRNFFESIDISSDSKVLMKDGDIQEAECVLIPTNINQGTYKLSITRSDTNFYKVDGKDIYIETQYCYEYAIRKDVTLVVTSTYGYNKGEIIF